MTETPGRGVGESARKRKRVELDITDTGARSVVHQSQSSSDFSVSTASKDVLEVSDCNPEAKFIKIFNTSDSKVGHEMCQSICSLAFLLFASNFLTL